MASSTYQNAGPGRTAPSSGAYRQNQTAAPPPGQYSAGAPSSYNYAGGQPSGYGPSTGSHSQMGYNQNYGYGSAGASSYGPPGVSSQNQYPPLPSYSLPSPPPPPPAAPPPPPPSAPPPPPPPPPPLSQSYQEGAHNQFYEHAPASSSSGKVVLSQQQSSSSAAPSRQHAPQAANNWSSGTDTAKMPVSAYPTSKQGTVGTQDKPSGASKFSKLPPSGMPQKVDARFEMDREQRKRDYERKRMEDKKDLKMPTSTSMHKFPVAGTPLPPKLNSATASRDGKTDQKQKFDNRLKRPSTFICKIKFRNELPDPISQPKLLQINTDRERYCKYSITSLERMQKHRLLVDPDLGIPLDLLDISVYNPPKVTPPLDPEDEELLRDDEKLSSVRNDIIRKKERPTDKGVAWLVKTQYISPISLDPAKQSLTEKQAKELKEIREGKRDFLDTLNDREKQIRSIQDSFRVSQQTPVHQTKPGLKPVEVFPLLPDFGRWESKYMQVTFDGEPTADSKLHNKLDHRVRDELEGMAILKSYNFSDIETGKPERSLAYMVPKVEELNNDSYEDMSYTWVREYHLEVRPEETHNFSTYLFSFGDGVARYLPLRQKVTLQKKKAKERSKEEGENALAIPSRVTVTRTEIPLEDEEHAARKLASAEGSRSSHGSKRRQSDGGPLMASKRRDQSRRLMSEEEDIR